MLFLEGLRAKRAAEEAALRDAVAAAGVADAADVSIEPPPLVTPPPVEPTPEPYPLPRKPCGGCKPHAWEVASALLSPGFAGLGEAVSRLVMRFANLKLTPDQTQFLATGEGEGGTKTEATV